MKRISLTQGQFAIVDDEDYIWLNKYKWCVLWKKSTQSFYAIRGSKKDEQKGNDKRHLIWMAREILGLKYSDKRQADHINHVTLNNRRSNLRIVTNQQNHFNQKSPKGYCWYKHWRKYVARISVNGRIIYLGHFNTAQEAHNTYLKAKKKYHKI